MPGRLGLRGKEGMGTYRRKVRLLVIEGTKVLLVFVGLCLLQVQILDMRTEIDARAGGLAVAHARTRDALGDTRQFSLYAGPYAGILLAATMKGTAEYEHQNDPDQSYTEDVDEGVEDSFNNFDYGVTMGVGLRIPLNQRLAATGDVRYNHGFSKLDSDDTDKMYNSSIGISLGLAFNLTQY